MNKKIAQLAFRYTPEFGLNKLDTSKPKANIWFIPFSILMLLITYNLNYDGKNSQKDD